MHIHTDTDTDTDTETQRLCVCVWVSVYLFVCVCVCCDTSCRGPLISYVSFAEYCLFYRALLQKRTISLARGYICARRCVCVCAVVFMCVCCNSSCMCEWICVCVCVCVFVCVFCSTSGCQHTATHWTAAPQHTQTCIISCTFSIVSGSCMSFITSCIILK